MMSMGSLASFADAERRSDSFDKLLSALGVDLKKGGELERLHLVLKELADWHAGKGAPANGADLRGRFRELVGLTHLIELALSVPPDKVLPFRKHFDLLNAGAPLQNVAAPRNDPSSDKVFELLVGLAAVRAGAVVTLDDPENSKGDNPDVLATFGNRTWGFACKVISGDAAATLYDRVEEGVDQIERSAADRGFVILSFKNRFDHEGALPLVGRGEDGEPLLGTHRDHAQIVEALKAFAEQRLLDMANYGTKPHITSLFENKKALPGVLVVAQTTAGIRLPEGVAPPGLKGAPVIARIGFLHLINMETSPIGAPSRFDGEALQVLDALNRALHV